MTQVINKGTIKESYKVSGMTCAACAISVESYLSPLEGIHNVAVNYPNQSVSLDFDNTEISIETIQKKIKEISSGALMHFVRVNSTLQFVKLNSTVCCNGGGI
ncbi:MAG: hypothetical protein COA82_13360 [Alkaliphilus sp.]|nr:MAG: hypothetical protein COA82_13360 [Alkaliphilus sp.]